jgi:hypothetical protein
LEAIKRRRFIGGSAATMLVAAAPVWPCSSVRAACLLQGDFAFFDQRFEKAQRIAASWPASIGAVAVRGDITPWSDVLVCAPGERPLLLRGATTESFRFCAAILVGDRADLDQQFSRLDQDLILWTMRTTPRRIAERRHG